MSAEDLYEIGLGNVHIPSHQTILVKNDFKRSYIQYNLGMFLYNNYRGEWELLENSNRELWKYAPNIDVEGIDSQSELVKADFIKRLFDSLILGYHTNQNKKCLELFIMKLLESSSYRDIIEKFNPEHKNHVEFKTLTGIFNNEDDRYLFFERIMRVLSLDPIEYVKNVLYTYKSDKGVVNKYFNQIKIDNYGKLTKLIQLFENDF